ncbi:MAG: hypothetical protein R3C97_15670 [Geminicoccaceae bacterium]
MQASPVRSPSSPDQQAVFERLIEKTMQGRAIMSSIIERSGNAVRTMLALGLLLLPRPRHGTDRFHRSRRTPALDEQINQIFADSTSWFVKLHLQPLPGNELSLDRCLAGGGWSSRSISASSSSGRSRIRSHW